MGRDDAVGALDAASFKHLGFPGVWADLLYDLLVQAYFSWISFTCSIKNGDWYNCPCELGQGIQAVHIYMYPDQQLTTPSFLSLCLYQPEPEIAWHWIVPFRDWRKQLTMSHCPKIYFPPTCPVPGIQWWWWHSLGLILALFKWLTFGVRSLWGKGRN